MILYTKKDDRADLPQSAKRYLHRYKNINLDESNLICIAGRPGMGKTSFALHLAQEYAKNSNKSVFIFSLELSAQQIYNRLLIAMANVDTYTFREQLCTDAETERVESAKQQISKYSLIIDDTPLLTPEQIEKKVGKIENIGMLIIDYFQLLWPDQENDNREREYEEIAFKLKQLSREKGIPVIIASHLPRYVEYRKDKRPLLSDLTGTGVPAQIMDTVCLIYREGYYDKDSDNGTADIIIAKNQYGCCGVLPFEWQSKYMKFVERDS